MSNTLKYIFSIVLLLLSFCAFAQEDEDDSTKAKNIFVDTVAQLRLEIDVSKFVANAVGSKRKSFEFSADYYWRKEIYLAAEGGWGSSHLDDADLNYSSTNTFFKAGINKSMLNRVLPNDWDMAFIGFRYAIGLIKRSDASYITKDSYWGTTTGTVPGQNMTAHWAELVGGVRLELYKGIYTGWTARGKFLLNKSKFKELPPYAIAGYGKGDHNTIFDFNFYLGYAIRWQKAPKAHRK